MSVQIGFVMGALLSALLNLADRVNARWLLAASALLGAGFNAAIALFVDSITPALGLRFFNRYDACWRLSTRYEADSHLVQKG